MRNRTIPSMWRTGGRFYRWQRRNAARNGSTAAPGAISLETCARAVEHVKKAHRDNKLGPYGVRTLSIRDLAAQRRAEARDAAFPASTHYQTLTFYAPEGFVTKPTIVSGFDSEVQS